MTKKLKPVWRLNTGYMPLKHAGQIIYKGKNVQVPVYRTMGSWLWRLEAEPSIYAYQTNRTREAKYERVECKYCANSQFKGLVYCGGYFEYRKCPECNGAGYTRETIK